MEQKKKIKAGFVPFGEVNTPKEIIEFKSKNALKDLSSLDWDITSTEPVYDDNKYLTAQKAVAKLKGIEMDLIIVCLAGWIPTHAVIKVIDNFKHIPMVLWTLSGWMKKGKLISTADQAGATSLNFVMKQLGYKHRFVYNVVNKPSPIHKIESFGKAAYTKRILRDMRIGSMGYRDMMLYSTTVDPASLLKTIGTEVEIFEMLEIVKGMENIDNNDVENIVEYCSKNWVFDIPVERLLLERGAKYFLSIKNKIEERNYKAITLNDVDGMKKLEGFPPAMILMLIADLMDVCTIPENDIMGNVTQLVVKELTGQSAHYMEFYEFFEKSVLLGVPDYIPSKATKGDIKMLQSKFGDLEGSISNVSQVKDGKVTLLRLVYDKGEYALHSVSGEAKRPIPWIECGWSEPSPQLPSLEIELDCPVEEFAEKVTSQHTIIAYGDITDEIEQFAYLTDIKVF